MQQEGLPGLGPQAACGSPLDAFITSPRSSAPSASSNASLAADSSSGSSGHPDLDFPELQGQFVVHEKISEGTFSAVYKASPVDQPDKFFALKRLHPVVCPDRVIAELLVMRICGGKNYVCPLLGGFRKGDRTTLKLPYFPHDNFQTFIRKMDVKYVQKYMKALLTAMGHLHEKNVIHRDIKFGTDEFLLIDFGLVDGYEVEPEAVRFPKRRKLNPLQAPVGNNPQKRVTPDRKPKFPHVSRAGTRGFRPPEVLLRRAEQTSAVDMWAAGMILLSILVGHFPICSPADDLDALCEISQIVGSRKLKEAAKFMDRDLQVPEVEFKGWKKLVKELSGREDIEWPKEVYDLVSKLLDPCPCSRITAAQALEHSFFQL